MKLSEITGALQAWAPLAYQEEYDNAGLLIDNDGADIAGVICSHDCTLEVVDEAIENGANLIVCHHPLIFGGLKQIRASDPVGAVVRSLISNNIALYSTHTALDNTMHGGNAITAQKLGLTEVRPLKRQSNNLYKLFTFCPIDKTADVLNALFEVGAGQIGNYGECSYRVEGLGTFRGEEGSDPYVGVVGSRHEEKEHKIEVIFEGHLRKGLIDALLAAHPYEEVAYDVVALDNESIQRGSGMIGLLAAPMSEMEFLKLVQSTLHVPVLKHTALRDKNITSVALCGGSGSFLIGDAIRAGADAFVTGDIGYHRFFDAQGRLLLVDAGHYESEQFVKQAIAEFLTEKFPTFAVHLSGSKTNPVNYYS